MARGSDAGFYIASGLSGLLQGLNQGMQNRRKYEQEQALIDLKKQELGLTRAKAQKEFGEAGYDFDPATGTANVNPEFAQGRGSLFERAKQVSALQRMAKGEPAQQSHYDLSRFAGNPVLSGLGYKAEDLRAVPKGDPLINIVEGLYKPSTTGGDVTDDLAASLADFTPNVDAESIKKNLRSTPGRAGVSTLVGAVSAEKGRKKSGEEFDARMWSDIVQDAQQKFANDKEATTAAAAAMDAQNVMGLVNTNDPGSVEAIRYWLGRAAEPGGRLSDQDLERQTGIRSFKERSRQLLETFKTGGLTEENRKAFFTLANAYRTAAEKKYQSRAGLYSSQLNERARAQGFQTPQDPLALLGANALASEVSSAPDFKPGGRAAAPKKNLGQSIVSGLRGWFGGNESDKRAEQAKAGAPVTPEAMQSGAKLGLKQNQLQGIRNFPAKGKVVKRFHSKDGKKTRLIYDTGEEVVVDGKL